MSLTLENARLFTATGAATVEDGALTIDGDTLTWVGRTGEAPGDGPTIDCGGRTVMPGLIDVHAHLVYSEVRDPYSIELSKPLEAAAVDAALNAALLQRMGFTAIRDVGTRGNIAVIIRDAIAEGRLPGPRVKASKQIISVWGGLGDMHPTHIFRREQYAAALTEIVTGPWEARNAVRQQVKDGVDWVKVEASGTGFNPLCPAQRDTMSFKELRAVCEEAEDKGKPVACHAESRNSIIKAAKAGVRTIEHAIYLDEEGTEAVLENKVAICPTIGLYTAYTEHGLEHGILPEIVAAHRITHEAHLHAIRTAHEAGVTIVAGSDSGTDELPAGRRHRGDLLVRRGDRHEPRGGAAERHPRRGARDRLRGHRHARARQARRPADPERRPDGAHPGAHRPRRARSGDPGRRGGRRSPPLGGRSDRRRAGGTLRRGLT